MKREPIGPDKGHEASREKDPARINPVGQGGGKWPHQRKSEEKGGVDPTRIFP